MTLKWSPGSQGDNTDVKCLVRQGQENGLTEPHGNSEESVKLYKRNIKHNPREKICSGHKRRQLMYGVIFFFFLNKRRKQLSCKQINRRKRQKSFGKDGPTQGHTSTTLHEIRNMHPRGTRGDTAG